MKKPQKNVCERCAPLRTPTYKFCWWISFCLITFGASTLFILFVYGAVGTTEMFRVIWNVFVLYTLYLARP